MEQPVWNTPVGDLGTFPSGKLLEIKLSATAGNLTTDLDYKLLNGTFPIGCTLSTKGVITGIPIDTPTRTVYTFTVRATDNFNNVTDRTFSFTVYGFIGAYFLVKSGEVINTTDSVFVDYQIQYSNPTKDNVIRVVLSAGELPPGLYIDDRNRIKGYAIPPIMGDLSPTSKTYDFSLQMTSELGNDVASYTITIRNQELTGPRNHRIPAIVNSQWLEYPLNSSDIQYSYYLQDDNRIPTIKSNEYFAFKILGYDFDKDNINYSFGKLPAGLVGDSKTGWIKGIPVISENSIQENKFTVQVYKANNPSIISKTVTYTVVINNNIQEHDIVWDVDSNLGIVDNGSVSELYVSASSSNELRYQLTDGKLPPNISLMPYTGHLVGNIPFEPNGSLTPVGTYTEYNFTITAYNPRFAMLSSSKTFTLKVYQKYGTPLERVYVKAFPNLPGKKVIGSLLNNDNLIPPAYLYRPDDINFGKATDVTYIHCYGMKSVNIQNYYSTVEKNHYRKKIVLGPFNTAIARDNSGQITYEVIYSPIIDDLQNYSSNKSSMTVTMPYKVELNNEAYKINNTSLLIDSGKIDINAGSEYTRIFYPNSLVNMRQRLLDSIPNVQDQSLLPAWMTSQQLNGDTLGYVECWVLCYCLPGTSETILKTINSNWAYTINDVDFTIDRYIIDKSMSYNYNTNLKTAAWTALPGASPLPSPIESRNVTVFFPNKTILPNN